MTDLGSFAAKTESMREHATYWHQRSEYADAGRERLVSCIFNGSAFGAMANLAGVGAAFNKWTMSMYTASADARTTALWFEAAMNSAANAYDGVDSTVATDMATLDLMISERV